MSETLFARRIDRAFRLALVLLVVLWGALSGHPAHPAHPAQAQEIASPAKEMRS